MKGNLHEFQKKFGIKRIDFGDVEHTEYEEQYGDGRIICPYCESEFDIECEEYDSILKGVTYRCPCCEKWFRIEAEVNVETTCTPIEDYLLEPWVRRNITEMYKHSDECNNKGLEWNLNNRYGYVEWETFKDYAEPLFENMNNNKSREEEE